MSGAPAAAFDAAYFAACYRDYRRQNPPRKLRFYRRLAAPPAASETRLLDAGCAFGTFLATLDAVCLRVGFDASPFAIAAARVGTPGSLLAVARLPEVPFTGPFDVVTSFDCLEHVEEVEAAFAAIARCLAPGGRFVFVVPVYDGLSGPLIRALDRDPTHVHRRGRAFWLDLAARHFVVQRWRGIVRYLVLGRFYLHVTTRLLRRHAPAIAVVAGSRIAPAETEASR